MTIYPLTAGSDTFTGSSGSDIFDGYGSDDGTGETGGSDMLSGLDGDDVFLIASDYSLVSGMIDGGTGFDTVRAYGLDLGSLDFQNVEALAVNTSELSLSIAQLNAFASIGTDLGGLLQLRLNLTGSGGAFTLAGKVAGGLPINVNAGALSSGYTATGTSAADIFRNSSYNDTVRGGGGADIFWAANQDGSSGGSDQVFGNAGADRFFLRSQSGVFDGGSGTDTVIAFQYSTGFGSRLGDLGDAVFHNIERLEAGPNITYATVGQLASFAQISGGNANGLVMFDARSGAGGTIDFSAKLDPAAKEVWLRCFGATSAVDVTGTGGNDTLTGSAFDDTLTGGDGDDWLGGADFSGGAHGKDVLVGGRGSDTYYIDPTDRLFELVGPDGGTDTVISITTCNLANTRQFEGEFENLTLNGQLGAENPDINGYGNGLDNVITGNDGDNRLDGRAGADHLTGNDGNDVYVVDNAGDVVEESQFKDRGTDTVLSSVSFDLGDANQALGFVENLVLTGSEALNGYGSEINNSLTGNDGDNILDGRAGQDVMKGRGGNDSFHVDEEGDRVLEAQGGGIDTVFTTVSFNLGPQSIENLWLEGDSNIRGTGNGSDNFVMGNGGDNVLSGRGGSDTLTGGDGNDVLNGGAGRDLMAGEGGNDIFRYTALGDSGADAATADRIVNFEAGDRIDLRAIDASANGDGNQAFALDDDASFSEGEIRQTQQGADMLLEFNTDADAEAEMAILLTGRTALLAAGDFTL